MINSRWGSAMKNCDIEGILPQGPYPPCLRMADKALLAEYPRYFINIRLVHVVIMSLPLMRTTSTVNSLKPGARFNIETSCYEYRISHCGDKTVVRSSHLHNGISYTGKMTSVYWIRALVTYMWVSLLATIRAGDIYPTPGHKTKIV